jgi:hypothetical protein
MLTFRFDPASLQSIENEKAPENAANATQSSGRQKHPISEPNAGVYLRPQLRRPACLSRWLERLETIELAGIWSLRLKKSLKPVGFYLPHTYEYRFKKALFRVSSGQKNFVLQPIFHETPLRQGLPFES